MPDLSFLSDLFNAAVMYKAAKEFFTWLYFNGPLFLLVLVAVGMPISLWALNKAGKIPFTRKANAVARVMALAVYLVLLALVGVLLWRGA